MTGKSKVVGIRLSAARLQKYVRAAAHDSLTYRQVLKCLQDGELVGQATLDEHSFWRFQMRRHAAGLIVTIDVAAQADGARIDQVFVLGFDAE